MNIPLKNMQYLRIKLMVAVLILVASGVTGRIVQGWSGIFIWPLTLCVIVLVFSVVLFVLDAVVSVRRARARMRLIEARLHLQPGDQLCKIMRNPTHPDSQFALIELMKRGEDAHPTKVQLFGMLTSGNHTLCMDAMTNLAIFYPELKIPEGSSNLDPPELWQSRVEALRKAEGLP